MKLIALLSALICAATVPSHGAVMFRQPGTGTTPDMKAFSGRWEGEVAIAQTGTCSIGAGQRMTRATALVLEVNSDGSVSADERPAGFPEPTNPRMAWRGRIADGLKVEFEGDGYATCNNRAREYIIKYRGKIERKKDRWQLDLTGNDPACQDTRCTFLKTYKLMQK